MDICKTRTLRNNGINMFSKLIPYQISKKESNDIKHVQSIA